QVPQCDLGSGRSAATPVIQFRALLVHVLHRRDIVLGVSNELLPLSGVRLAVAEAPVLVRYAESANQVAPGRELSSGRFYLEHVTQLIQRAWEAVGQGKRH